MPKSLIVHLTVPSGSRQEKMHPWLNKLLQPHKMEAVTVHDGEALSQDESMSIATFLQLAQGLGSPMKLTEQEDQAITRLRKILASGQSVILRQVKD